MAVALQATLLSAPSAVGDTELRDWRGWQTTDLRELWVHVTSSSWTRRTHKQLAGPAANIARKPDTQTASWTRRTHKQLAGPAGHTNS
ncbi:hypothetical protein RRG08_061345 [Elysia crispata]|uniref:Uncharacterized protein n=1 Tax=Elysia crispata TaxID=231223 RepID=A0AAE1DXN1_9GAST|nr:hypothetical protein RRG08_061345 [Elysia crispata]